MLILSSSFAYSQSIPVFNHAYEFDTIPQEIQKTTSISGWWSSGDGAIGIEIPLGGGIAYNGFDNLSQAAFIEEGGKISQELDFNVIKGQSYTLKYRIGRPLGEQGHSLIARLKAQGLTLAQHQSHVTQLAEGQWGEAELSFTATENMPIGTPIAIEFYNPPSEVGAKVHIDSISLHLVASQSTPSNLINITVLNNNYEFDTVPVDSDKTDFISGWLNTGNGDIGVEFPQGGIDYSAYSSLGQAAYLEKGGRISQALDITLEKGETYTLYYNVGRPLGTADHSIMARLKSQGLVLAQQHTRAEHLEPGQRLVQSLSFTATEDMPLGSVIAIEFYNPPTAHGAKVHVDNVQMLIAGTGEDYIAPPLVKFPEQVIGDVVDSDLTINIPEDFDDLYQAIAYLDNKIIQNDKLVTIQVNSCGYTYNEPLVMSHPQGSQIIIQGHATGCNLSFRNEGGFVVTTALKALRSFNFYGPNNNGTITGLFVKDGATVGESAQIHYQDLGNGVAVTEGGFVRVYGRQAYSNQNTGVLSTFGGLLETDSFQTNANPRGLRADQAGMTYAKGYFNLYNPLGVYNGSYAFFQSNVHISNKGLYMYASALSNIDFTGSFTNRSSLYKQYHRFAPSYSSWLNYDNNPRYRRDHQSHNSWNHYR